MGPKQSDIKTTRGNAPVQGDLSSLTGLGRRDSDLVTLADLKDMCEKAITSVPGAQEAKGEISERLDVAAAQITSARVEKSALSDLDLPTDQMTSQIQELAGGALSYAEQRQFIDAAVAVAKALINRDLEKSKSQVDDKRGAELEEFLETILSKSDNEFQRVLQALPDIAEERPN